MIDTIKLTGPLDQVIERHGVVEHAREAAMNGRGYPVIGIFELIADQHEPMIEQPLAQGSR